MTTALNKNISSGLLLIFSASTTIAWAGQSLEEIQRQFNQETISKPFSVPDDKSLTESLKAATDRGTPTKSPGYMAPNVPFLGGFGYYGGHVRPYYGGYYGRGYYNPYYGGWW